MTRLTQRLGGSIVTASFLIVIAILVRGYLAQPPAADLEALGALAQSYDVTIRRDAFGVPHIDGKTDADAAFGIAFAHAEDDFATIQDVVIATRGSLGAVHGPDAAVTDYLVALLDVWGPIRGRYDTDISPEVRHIIEAYADGLNYYAARHSTEVIPGTLPFTGQDVAAGFVFKTPFFYGLDKELLKLFQTPQGKRISTGRTRPFQLVDEPEIEIGSNAVAVAPLRSSDGATRLLVNSHQPYAGPVAWYEAVVRSAEGWEVAGGFFPGTPFMLHGHNRHLGWANTVNKPDLVDVYDLTVNPDNENQYLLDGEWQDFERHEVDIKVKLWGPFWWTVSREVLRSAHGPVVRTDGGAYALRYAGMNEIRQVEQYYRLNRAASLAEWQSAMAIQALPSINYIYADEAGNIGYVYNAQMPLRAEGPDWSGHLPGDRSDLIWTQYRPYDEIPKLINPDSGLVFNANNTPFRASDTSANLRPEEFPVSMGIEMEMTNRALRQEELYAGDPMISSEEFRTYKFDLAYSQRSFMGDMIAEALSFDARGDADMLAAQDLLKTWDFSTDVDNRGAALAVLMASPAIRANLEGTEAPDTIEALRQAITGLKDHFARLDPRWGDVNRIVRGPVDLAIDGGPDILRAVYGRDLNGDGHLTAVAGDTFIMFVEWDRDGRLQSESIHQFGTATQDERSPHYADQTPLFVRMATKPVHFERDSQERNAVQVYRPSDR